MQEERVQNIVLLLMVASISLLFLAMIQQFLLPLFIAGLAAAMAAPLHRWLARKLGDRENLASIIIILSIFMLILFPCSILVGIIVGQAVSVGQSVTPWVQSFINEPTILAEYLEKLPYYEEIRPYQEVIISKAGEMVSVVVSFCVDSLTSLTKMTISVVFGSVIMLYIMFYFLTIGDVLLEKILYFLPLKNEDEQILLQRFTSVTRATLKGTLVIGIMQGAICGVAFAFAGISGSVFWGSVMAVASVIPAFGTALVWGPALFVLILLGNFKGAAILLLLCGLISGNLDNLVRPRLVGRDTEMHDLFILLSTLGGIAMFGLPGIVIGPIIAALFISLWEIYGRVFGKYLPAIGKIRGCNSPQRDDS